MGRKPVKIKMNYTDYGPNQKIEWLNVLISEIHKTQIIISYYPSSFNCTMRGSEHQHQYRNDDIVRRSEEQNFAAGPGELVGAEMATKSQGARHWCWLRDGVRPRVTAAIARIGTLGISLIHSCASLIGWRDIWLPRESHSYPCCLHVCSQDFPREPTYRSNYPSLLSRANRLSERIWF